MTATRNVTLGAAPAPAPAADGTADRQTPNIPRRAAA